MSRGAVCQSDIAFATGTAQALEKTLETPIVIGDQVAAPLSHLVGYLDVLSHDEHADDSQERFNKVPGVYLSRDNQGIINNQGTINTDVAIRGFAGDGVTPHAALGALSENTERQYGASSTVLGFRF